VCLGDDRGCGSRSGAACPKAALLQKALSACEEVEDGLTPDQPASAARWQHCAPPAPSPSRGPALGMRVQ